jgi:hypothetical protein
MQVPLKAVALKVSVNYKRGVNSYLLRLSYERKVYYSVPSSKTDSNP